MPRRPEDIPAAGRSYYTRNKPRIQAYKRARYLATKQQEKDNRLFRKYGITREEYNARATEQEDRCKLCRRPAAEDRDGVLHVDHSHLTGNIRGLLCSQCNVALGLLQDSPALMRLAADYIENAA